MQKMPVRSLGREDHQEREQAARSSVLGLPCGSDGRESACNAGDLGRSLVWEDPLEKGMATHSSSVAWRLPWAEEPDRLYSPWNSPDQNTGVGSLSLLQSRIFPIQGSNQGLLHCRRILYHLSHREA